MIQQILVILNLFLLECILSIDNAAVLAIMFSHLPQKDRNKALRYGIIGAFIFRGASLFIASWLIKLFYLKILGGMYLVWLTFKSNESEDNIYQPPSLIKTIIAVEFLDLAFSIDNVFAAVAITSNYYLILIGIFMGIVAMRFVAGWFTKLMEKCPYLEVSAYWVIFLLGAKLVIEGVGKWINRSFEI